jgi:molybdate transport system substrate-binding protein
MQNLRLPILARKSLSALLLLVLATSFSVPGMSAELLVSAAVSLKGSLEDCGKLFQDRTGMVLQFNFAASGILQKQIEGGAPVDVFASAGQVQMDELGRQGLLLRESRCDFTRNALVLIVPNDSVGIRSFADLAGPALKRLAIGNPKTVPAGLYSRQTLRSLKLWDKIQSRLIPAEDVRQVLDYVSRGEADAGLVYATDVSVARGRAAQVVQVPDSMHDPILYPVAVIRDSQHKTAARQFIDLLLSPEGQAILQKNGFLPVR